MARMRFDGLKATLNGALTNSATSITFAAALTYHGLQADAVPTLGSNDYIPLGILDANGVVCEIVWLTAYTSGSTTGTIARGKEGTTGIAHVTGHKVVCAATSRDLQYSGCRFDNPDDPLWGADLGYDMEFETDDTSGSLPSGYAWTNGGTSTYAQKWGAAILTPQTSGGSDNNRLLTRSLSGFPSTWEATVKMPFTAYPTNWYRAGLVLRDSTNGKFTFFGRAGGGGWMTGETFINDWNSATSFSGGETHVFTSDPLYLKIKKNSTTYDFLVSADGIGWTAFVTGKSAFSTYDQIGFAVHAPVSGWSQAFHWLRVR